MRLRRLPLFSTLSILILSFFAFIGQTVPTSRLPSSAVQSPGTSKHSSITFHLHKRARSGHRHLANGWIITYQIFNVIFPILSSHMELRTLYTETLNEVSLKMAAGDVARTRERFHFGKYVLEFLLQPGHYRDSIGWEYVTAFAEKMLESQLPMTYLCHIYPPGSDAGMQLEAMWRGPEEILVPFNKYEESLVRTASSLQYTNARS
ncbi:MAG: hypothetical protein L6R40_001148 [Gallowayella cf. fulva]|nr:MAG: hypothetical protein L6R40_001148 [Xanthomendoza cf. fulva]